MKRLLASFALVACSAAPVTKATTPVATASPPIRCNGGRELDFSRKLQNGDVTQVTLRCTDEEVTASVVTFIPGPPDLDAAPVIRESGGPTVIDHAVFDRVWRGAFARADERGCQRRRVPATTVLTLRDTHDKREVTCFDLDVTDVVEPLRAVVKVAPPPPPSSEVVWPFGGEYWKDELRYYSAR